jgi:hypothetical protein
MSYIDIIIPLALGLFLITTPQSMVKPSDPSFEKKKSVFQKSGYMLLGVAVLYGIIKVLA